MNDRDHVSEEELNAYVDNELPADRRSIVEAWLATHPDDGARVAAWRKQAELLCQRYGHLEYETPPSWFDLDRLARRRYGGLAAIAATIVAFLIFPFIQQIAIHDTHTWPEIFWHMIEVKITMPGLIPFGITIFALLLGGIPAYMMYIKGADTPNTRIPEKGIMRKLYNFLLHRWYINEGYYWFVNKFLNFADHWRRTVDEPVIDGIDYKSADAAIAISTKVRAFDDNVVDGFAEGISTVSVEASESGLRSQTGRINDYVGVVIFGIGLLVIIALLTWGVI